MSLRILGGNFKGRTLKTPKGSSTRPTLALVRKALFDICQEKIIDAGVLDLFAGTGAIGLEALSRGARFTTFVENHPLAIQAILDNIRTLKVESSTHLMKQSIFLSLKTLTKQQKTFDLIYVDPPYILEANLMEKLLFFFDQNPLLKPGGFLFIEEKAPGVLGDKISTLSCLTRVSSRTFSQTLLHQFTLYT